MLVKIYQTSRPHVSENSFLHITPVKASDAIQNWLTIENKKITTIYKGITVFEKGYLLNSILVKDENGDVLADSHNFLYRWKSNFPQTIDMRFSKVLAALQYV
jgi:hypothetical protein